MKLKYRFLIPTLIVMALAMAFANALSIRTSFYTRLADQREKLIEQMQLYAYATQAACTNYALQGIEINADDIIKIAKQQNDKIVIAPVENRFTGFIQLDQGTLRGEMPLQISDKWYSFTLNADVSDLYLQRTRELSQYHGIYLGTMLLIAGILFLIAGHVTKSLAELTHVCVELSKQNLSCRVQVSEQGEIGLLSNTLNHMADEITDQISRRTRFIENLTHEIKTPLASIVGHADTIRSGMLTESEVLIAAQTILHEGKRLSTLSTTLSNWILLKQEMPVFHDLSVDMLFEEVIHTFQVFTGRIIVASDSQHVLLHGDKTLLISLLINLIRNAQNAGASNVVLKSEVFTSSIVRICVADNGCGMEQETLAFITEPFYRVDKARSRANGGLGLGLSLCKEIIHLHCGSLHFESTVGQGTTVYVEIPGKAANEDI